jgi:hypothetical protein
MIEALLVAGSDRRESLLLGLWDLWILLEIPSYSKFGLERKRDILRKDF